jgi:hypothetical protein
MKPQKALTFSTSSSRPEIGSLKSATLTIAAGESRATATFSAAAPGTTTLSLTLSAELVQLEAPVQMVIVVN